MTGDLPDIDALPREFTVDDSARVERLERQVLGLQRQLEHRIRQVAHYQGLEAQVAGDTAATAGASGPGLLVEQQVVDKAAAYDNLLARPSLRALRAGRRLLRGAASALAERRTR